VSITCADGDFSDPFQQVDDNLKAILLAHNVKSITPSSHPCGIAGMPNAENIGPIMTRYGIQSCTDCWICYS
jgi:hypothetical protein